MYHENRRVKEKINKKIDDYVNNLVNKYLQPANKELQGAAGVAAREALVEQF